MIQQSTGYGTDVSNWQVLFIIFFACRSVCPLLGTCGAAPTLLRVGFFIMRHSVALLNGLAGCQLFGQGSGIN